MSSDSIEERELWHQSGDFLLYIIGFSVDFATVLVFPSIIFYNGGSAFLILYILMVVGGAFPVFIMEVLLGQYNRAGPFTVWKICPIFKGIGISSILITFYASCFYNVNIAWTFYFLFVSFTTELPWTRCNNTWNTNQCWERTKANDLYMRQSFCQADPSACVDHLPAFEYFEREVLKVHESTGLHDLGPVKWDVMLCLLLTFVIIFISIYRGPQHSVKLLWVTVTLPYLILGVLLLRGTNLSGAKKGIAAFTNADFESYLNFKDWLSSSTHIFFSLGVGFGAHLLYASYNKFHHSCFRDVCIATALNFSTSIISGFVIFSYIGHLAESLQVPIDGVVVKIGPELGFQVYPENVSRLEGSQLRSILFYILLLTLGIDSTVGALLIIVTSIVDQFPHFFARRSYSREILSVLVIGSVFSVALTTVTRGGRYMVAWFEVYSAGLNIFIVCLLETIAVAWIYGIHKFADDIYEMLNYRPGIFFRVWWKFVTPLFLIVCIVITCLYGSAPDDYKGYEFPVWSIILGWLFFLSSLAPVFIWAVVYMCMQKGSFKVRFAFAITPEDEHEDIRELGIVTRYSWKHWLKV